MKRNKKRNIIIALVLVLALVLGMSEAAFAATDGSTSATVIFEQDTTVNKLELVTAPAFNFGTNQLPVGSETITSVDVDGSLKVSDTRGTFEGWNVTAELSNFKTETVTNSMPGAYITLANGNAAKEGPGTSASPTVQSNITLTSGGSAALIADAAVNAGIGVWNITWNESDVALTVLETPALNTNTATINWTITNGPQS